MWILIVIWYVESSEEQGRTVRKAGWWSRNKLLLCRVRKTGVCIVNEKRRSELKILLEWIGVIINMDLQKNRDIWMP